MNLVAWHQTIKWFLSYDDQYVLELVYFLTMLCGFII